MKTKKATEELAFSMAQKAGDFYASTGIELKDHHANEKQVTIAISAKSDRKYRVQFIGRNGRVLQETIGNSMAYTIKGDEGYVRARITDSDGKIAWTQPVFLKQ